MIELCELREEDGTICGTPFVCSPSQEAESLAFRIYHEDYEPLCDGIQRSYLASRTGNRLSDTDTQAV